MEAVRTSETSVDNHFTRQYNPEDSSEHHTRRRENLKSHNTYQFWQKENRRLCSVEFLYRIVLLEQNKTDDVRSAVFLVPSFKNWEK
jgi:hypothetical protein